MRKPLVFVFLITKHPDYSILDLVSLFPIVKKILIIISRKIRTFSKHNIITQEILDIYITHKTKLMKLLIIT